MLHKMFSIYDTKVEAYLQPIFLPTIAAAIRAVTDTVNDPNHHFNKHPEDYVLFDLGQFSDTDCTFQHHDAPKSLGVLIEFLSETPLPFEPPAQLKKA